MCLKCIGRNVGVILRPYMEMRGVLSGCDLKANDWNMGVSLSPIWKSSNTRKPLIFLYSHIFSQALLTPIYPTHKHAHWFIDTPPLAKNDVINYLGL